MKKSLLLVFGVFMFFISQNTIAQETQQSDDQVFGESSDFLIGIHSGVFDCNSWVKYPYNIGAVAQFNYIPDLTKNWFFGAEVGAFYTQSKEEKPEKWGRSTKGAFADITVYPGLSFPIGTGYSSEDNEVLRLKKLAQARKFKVGLGFTVAIPLVKKSEGVGVNTDAVKAGFGFSARTSYDVTKKLSIFANATRIGRDLDGLGFINKTSTERIEGNKHKTTYYYKIGVLWSFLGK
ncbi:MAG: hypothetical protein ACM3PT_01045 [Deltaproteobacteria bacterium]